MSEIFTVSDNDILHQVKLSCQIPAIVQSIVTRRLIQDVAAEHDVKVEPNELQQTADSIRLINRLHNASTTWSWLQKHCLSLDEFEELAGAAALSSKLAQHLFEDKVEPFFVAHQIEYTQVALYEVIFDDADLAMELFYALQESEINFHAMAHQYIQDAELRRSGGYRGLLTRQDLKPEISAAVFAATPPQILKPIVTSEGVHLILVEEFISPKLTDVLHYKILSDLFANWLKHQIERVEVITQLDGIKQHQTPR